MAAVRALPVFSPVVLQEGLAQLSRGEVFRRGSLDDVLSELAEQACRLTGVERAGIWAFNHDHTELRCLELFTLSRRRHSAGEMLRTEQYPAYFLAIERDGGIIADDVYSHPATQDMADTYLLRHGITAVLNTPIYIRGDLQGMLCLEQVGMRQPWSSVHRLFAQSVANLVTLALVEFEASEAKKHADTASERLRAVFEASPDALLLSEEPNGVILDANREAEKLFGYRRAELIGKLRHSLHAPATEHDWPGESPHLTAEVLCNDGRVVPVEVTAEVAELEDGRRLSLGIYRPLAKF